MKTRLIVNPESGSARQYEQIQQFIKQRDITCMETAEEGDAGRFVVEAVEDGADAIGIAGGDGTVNTVVNGAIEHEEASGVRLGVIPLGTGNDFARTLGLADDPRDALALLQAGATRALDAMRLGYEDTARYGINVAAGGFSGRVDEVMNDGMKERWGPLAYILGAANALPDIEGYDIHVTYDDEEEEDVDAFNVIVANGRTAGGGKRVAPMANPQDGLLDVVVVEPCSLGQMTRIGTQLMAGNYQNNPNVHHRRVRRVHVEADLGMWFNIDGELLTRESVTFSVVPEALTFVVSNEYQPDILAGA
jgi:diacylglycerol kinase (ATP)